MNSLKDIPSSTHFNTMWQTIYNLFNSQVLKFPFPHWYTENIFPEDFFLEIVKNLPAKESYVNIVEANKVNYSKETANETNRYIFDLI